MPALKGCSALREGNQNSTYRLERIADGLPQIDLFFAYPATADLLESTPGNWGSVLLCRTGSRQHNIYLVERAKSLGLVWNPYRGVLDNGRVIASETKEEIFAALKLDFIPPQNRERNPF